MLLILELFKERIRKNIILKGVRVRKVNVEKSIVNVFRQALIVVIFANARVVKTALLLIKLIKSLKRKS
jgi:hypothetical protein